MKFGGVCFHTDFLQRLADPEFKMNDESELFLRKRFQVELAFTHPTRFPKVKRCIVHNDATVIKWSDGTTTRVICHEGEKFDLEKAIFACMAKRAFGNGYNWYDNVVDAFEKCEVLSGERVKKGVIERFLKCRREKHGISS